MFLPFKYGAPAGVVFVFLLWLQIHGEWNSLTLWRWFIDVAGLLGLVAWDATRFNRTVDFRTIWFAGFSALMAAAMIFALSAYVLRTLLFSSIEAVEEVGMLSIIFYEFLSHAVMGLIVLTILAAVLGQRAKVRNRKE